MTYVIIFVIFVSFMYVRFQALAFIGNKVRQVRANNINTRVSYKKNSSPEAEVRAILALG